MDDSTKDAIVDEAMTTIGGGQNVALLIRGATLIARGLERRDLTPGIVYVEDLEDHVWWIDISSIDGFRPTDDE